MAASLPLPFTSIPRYNPIVRGDFISGILEPLYGHFAPNLDRIHSHALSVFFILLASGRLYDSMPSTLFIAEQYYALARAALSLDPILNEATCWTVQALFMSIGYIFQSNRTSNEARWLLTGLTARAAQIVSGRWFLSSTLIGSN